MCLIKFLVFPQYTTGKQKYIIQVEPGSTKSVTWLINEEIPEGFISDGLEFSGEIIPDVQIENGLYIGDERRNLEVKAGY